MLIPAKYQLSRENDPDNSTRINNITKKYNTCLKKFGFSYNKLQSQLNKENKENQPYLFQNQVLEWYFKLPYIERIKVSTVNNKWVFQTLHQLYTENKKKSNLKFIPRINEKPPFLQKLAGTDIFADKPGHFLNYFAFSSQNYELINNYNEKIEKDFLNEILFFYPDLPKISKIKMNDKETLDNLNKYYYPVFTLSDDIINNQDKFIKYFKVLSNNNYFVMPPEIKSLNTQNEQSDDKNSDNNSLINNFKNNTLNPLNKIINKYNNNISENNTNNTSYNNKIQNYIDLPFWAKQPKNSKICFSINELLLAFIEQNIIVHYIIFSYDNQFYNSIIADNFNSSVEEFISLKGELKDFLSINKENLLDLLNIDLITKEIYYNANIEKFVSIKKYQDDLISKTKCWKENINFEEEYNQIKEFFSEYNNDNKSMIRLINDISTFNFEQIYSFEDFFFNKIFYNLNKKYEDWKELDLLTNINTNQNTSKNKKKKKRNKKKKKKENEDKIENDINTDNKINIDIDQDLNNINNNENENENKEKIIEFKKYISIEEDEELSRIKKGYQKLESSDNNLCESSGSENNCDSKPLLKTNSDIKQIMKEKENKYNANNEENIIEDINNINIEDKKEPDKNEIKNEEENNIKEDIKPVDSKENKEQEKENSINIINNQENQNNNSNKKKKGGNFFLYPTNTKKNSDKINKPPFIMKLNEDIIFYNKNLLMILDSLLSLKEFIIERIKSQINECLYNDNFTYKIDIYGSFQTHLDIVCSDIDMVFIPNKINSVDISDLIQRLSNHLLASKEYFKVTPIYTASIPLIKLMINYENYLANNKNLLNNYSKLINSDLYKKYPFDKEKEISFINIDISFPVSYNNKKNKNTPFLQIEYVRNSLQKYTDASIVIRILKRALKLTDMNNSYKGGLSSYTLFLMVISFLKNNNRNNGINNNNKPKKNSYGHAFHDSVKFFSKFNFYSNVIDIENKNGEIFSKRTKRYSSPEYDNIPVILDPVNGQNAGKSSFRINDVQKTFVIINEELEKLRNIYDKNNDNKDNIDIKDHIENNMIITLVKNVEKRILNK